MIIIPFKRVGAPASLRGIRGAYLNTLLMYGVGALFLMLVLLMLPLPIFIRIPFIVIIIVGFIFKFNSLKKDSKGDLNISLKKNCRKNIILKHRK